ncbi:DUF930 domain-containing protein [Bradyrhizobium sp.]|uniref:DUF930 domain-containing protein n=1 Tax=Bradyrhizobium sp. TaxID=376 RepID=UPI0039E4F475
MAAKRSMVLISLFACPAFCAPDERFVASLRRLDPDMRLEQICDYEAMTQIGQADRAKSYVISPPLHVGNTLKANGGAFRRNGAWFRVSFVCTATADHLRVLSFKLKVGGLIPRGSWQAYGLWD